MVAIRSNREGCDLYNKSVSGIAAEFTYTCLSGAIPILRVAASHVALTITERSREKEKCKAGSTPRDVKSPVWGEVSFPGAFRSFQLDLPATPKQRH